MKLLSSLVITSFFTFSALSAVQATPAAASSPSGCHCKQCACAKGSDCGCFSGKGCHCASPDAKCGNHSKKDHKAPL